MSHAIQATLPCLEPLLQHCPDGAPSGACFVQAGGGGQGGIGSLSGHELGARTRGADSGRGFRLVLDGAPKHRVGAEPGRETRADCSPAGGPVTSER